MSGAQTVRFWVGIIGNIISGFLFLSPIPTFWKIYKNKAVEGFDYKPYVATILNCLFWCYYGMPFVNPNSILVVTINGAGLAIELIYLAIFAYYAAGKARKRVGICLFLEIVIFVAIVAITMKTIPQHKILKTLNRPLRAVVIGIICDIFNVIMYASPLFIVRDVIATKSVKYMPFYLSFTSFLNGCCWTAYSLIWRVDYFILISNGLGAIAGAIQLIVYAKYYKSTPKDEESKPPTDQLQLSNIV